MSKAGNDNWKTPLGVYERSIAELRRTREEIQAEMRNLRQMQVSLGELSNLKTELENSQVKIESLKADLEKTKAELLITQKIASEAQHRVVDAEREAYSAQKQLENLKLLMNNNQNGNPQLIEIVSKLQEKLDYLSPINIGSSQDGDFKSQIIQSISDLRSQFSKLSNELMFVSPFTGIDYTRLRKLLRDGEWKKADEETLKLMIEISNRDRDGWRWLDRGEIERYQIEIQTLKTEIKTTKETAKQAQIRVMNAEESADASQRELQVIKAELEATKNELVRVQEAANQAQHKVDNAESATQTELETIKTQIESLKNSMVTIYETASNLPLEELIWLKQNYEFLKQIFPKKGKLL